MRNATLASVRSKVKAETQKAIDPTSTSQDAEINQIIETCQQELADAYEWGFLKQRWFASLAAGQRFCPFPVVLATQGGAPLANMPIDFNKDLKMEVKWNQIWQPVDYGIDNYPEFNYLDSDRGVQLDPIQRFQYSDNSQFEVWPLPASPAQVCFTQNRALVSLQQGATNPPTWNDAALLDLDDLLVVFYVAAIYSTQETQSDDNLNLERFKKRLTLCLGSNPVRTEQIIIGRGTPMNRKMMRQVPLVVVAGSTH